MILDRLANVKGSVSGRILVSRPLRILASASAMEGKAELRELRIHPGGRKTIAFGISYKDQRWSHGPNSQTVVRAFEMFVHEGVSYHTIADHFGVPGNSVRYWLTNPIYRGIMSYRWEVDPTKPHDPTKPNGHRRLKQNPFEIRVFGEAGQEPQLVSDELWQRAQDRIEKSLMTHRRSRTSNSPLIPYTGMLYSAYEPRGPIDLEWSQGYVYFGFDEKQKVPEHVCWGHVPGGQEGARYECRCLHSETKNVEGWVRCGLRRLPAASINRAIETYIQLMTSEDWFVAGLMEVAGTVGDQTDRHEKTRAELEKAIQGLDKKKARLLDLYLEGGLEKDIFQTKKASLDAEIQGKKTKLEKLGDAPKPLDRNALVEAAKALSFDPKTEPAVKRAWLKKYMPAVFVSNDGIDSADVALEISKRPGPDGMPVYHMTYPITWVELLGHDPFSRARRQQADVKEKGLFTSDVVARELGIRPQTLRGYISEGQLPKPSQKIGRLWAWTAEELEAAKTALAEDHASQRSTGGGIKVIRSAAGS